MWVIENNQQLFSFVAAVIFGAAFCLFYDLLRAYRSVLSCSTLTVFFQDIFFWLVVALTTFLLMLALCSGEIRAYICFAEIFGFLVCRLTVSKLFFFVIAFILKKLISVLKAANRLLNSLNDKISRLFLKVCRFFAKKFKNIGKYFKKPLETRR